MKFSTISFRNETWVVSSPPSLGDRAKYGKSALFQRGETHTCACFPRDERENKAFRRENATENGTFDVSSSFLCKTFPFLSFFSFFFFLLSYEHTTRRRFTFEFNNDINFCSLFFFLSFLFSFFLLFFSFNPFRCKRGKKFRLSSFPRLLPFSPAREGGRNWLTDGKNGMDTRDLGSTRFPSRLFYGNACFWVNRAFLSILAGCGIIHDVFKIVSFSFFLPGFGV